MRYLHAPETTPRERPICGRCRRCHPGRQFGGDTFCTNPNCHCHRKDDR